jgi:AraC-like DNA-binding protein/CheY-like chemotaxis protein
MEAAADERQERSSVRASILVLGEDIGTVAAVAVALDGECLVKVAPNVTEAIWAITARRPDLVLMDVCEDVVDQMSFLRTLRSRAPGCLVVVIVPGPHATAVRELAAIPLDGLLQRPLDVAALLARVHGLLALRGMPPFPRPGFGRHVSRTFEYLSSRYGGRVKATDVARGVGVSRSHLEHLFRQETGMKLTECLTRLRVEVAKCLLATTDGNLDVIADQSGFCDASHLSRVFRRYAGRKPGEYRRDLATVRGLGLTRRATSAPEVRRSVHGRAW